MPITACLCERLTRHRSHRIPVSSALVRRQDSRSQQNPTKPSEAGPPRGLTGPRGYQAERALLLDGVNPRTDDQVLRRPAAKLVSNGGTELAEAFAPPSSGLFALVCV